MGSHTAVLQVQRCEAPHHHSVSVSSDVDWCVCRWHRPLYERCTIVVRLFSRWRPHSDNLPSSFSSVSGLRLRYRHEFWHFCRRTSSVSLASLRSAVVITVVITASATDSGLCVVAKSFPPLSKMAKSGNMSVRLRGSSYVGKTHEPLCPIRWN